MSLEKTLRRQTDSKINNFLWNSRNRSALCHRRQLTESGTLSIHQRVLENDASREAWNRGCLQAGMRMWSESLLGDLPMIRTYRNLSSRLICVWTTEAAIMRRRPASGRSTTTAKQISGFACQSRAYGAPQTPPPDAHGEEPTFSNSAWTTHRPPASESCCKLCRVACYLSLIDRRFIKPQLIYALLLPRIFVPWYEVTKRE